MIHQMDEVRKANGVERSSVPPASLIQDTSNFAADDGSASSVGEPQASEDAKSQASVPPMLDVHAPHSIAHTWKDFFIHIATIVVGLFIAVGLEQAVEFFHHRHQIAETKEALRQEREENHKNISEETAYWRWTTAELQNNLQVLQYLRQHPGTAQEKLPGILLWAHVTAVYRSTAWNSAQQTGITVLMPQNEVAQTALLYEQLKRIRETTDTKPGWRSTTRSATRCSTQIRRAFPRQKSRKR